MQIVQATQESGTAHSRLCRSIQAQRRLRRQRDAAKGNRNTLVDQLAAAGKDVRTVDQACPLPLAAVGGVSPEAAPVWKHNAADRGFAANSRVGSAFRRNQSGRRTGVEGGVLEKSLRNGANHGLLVLAKALPGASGSLALERIQKKIAAVATGSVLSPLRKQNGKPG